MKKLCQPILFVLLTLIADLAIAQRKQVLLDSYFNNEHKKDDRGISIPYHYKWNEADNDGFSIFKEAFKNAGASGITMLNSAPDMDVLGSADVYIIVDPDTKKESPNPKYIRPENVEVIRSWVKQGGVLLLMANDSANVELKHFNMLAERFGISPSHHGDDGLLVRLAFQHQRHRGLILGITIQCRPRLKGYITASTDNAHIPLAK